MRNVLVRVRLADGATGFGEAAPLAAFNGERPAGVLRAIRSAGRRFVGRDAAAWLPLLTDVERATGSGAARAGLSSAILDAWMRSIRQPLHRLFGGAGAAVRSDVTVPLEEPVAAAASARRIVRLGVATIKVKLGGELDEDEERLRAIAGAAPRVRLLLDANQAYEARGAIELLRRLRRRAIAPALFEQPVAADDWGGLADVHRHGRVDVAADESVSTREDAVAMAARRCAQVVNVKVTKSGVLEAWDIARICSAAGLGLMVGAMVESPLGLAVSAHLAAGHGGFAVVDLDTSLWLAERPTRGPDFGRGGRWDLSGVRAGIGVVPRPAWVRALDAPPPPRR